MIRINLLPVRQARKLEAARREVMLILAVGGAVLFACLAGWGLAQGRLATIDAQNAALQQEIDSLAADVKKVDEMEKFKEELERKLAVIQELRERKNGPVHMLEEISLATPERLQLVTITEEGGNVRMEGLSVSNEIISQFLRSLEASPYFANVYLDDIEAKADMKDAPVPVKAFKLTAKLVTPKPDEKPAATPAPADGAATPAPTEGAPPAEGAAPAPAAPPTGGGA